MKPKAIICDIDGVLLLSKDGKAPYEKGYKVKGGITESLLGFLISDGICSNTEVKVILLTGRHEDIRKQTENELSCNLTKFHQLIMNDTPRVSGRMIPTHKYKREKTKQIMEDYEVLLAIDDCDKNILMFQALGIPTLQAKFE